MNKKAEFNVLALVLLGLILILALVSVVEHYDTERALNLANKLESQRYEVCIDGCMNSEKMSCGAITSPYAESLACDTYCASEYEPLIS